MISNLIGWLVTTVVAAAQPVAGLVGVTLDDAFQLVGSNSSGLIATINITSLAPGMIAGNFVGRIFDDKGKVLGEMAPRLALAALGSPAARGSRAARKSRLPRKPPTRQDRARRANPCR